MNGTMKLLTGAAAGYAAAYMLDPDRGKRRRALMRDQLSHARHKAMEGASAGFRDLGNRTRGAVFEARYRLGGTDDPYVLEERVRSALGRATSHPSAISVVADEDMCVTVYGAVLSHESEGLLDAVRKVPGVTGVRDHLERYASAENVPDLQGKSNGRRSQQAKPDILQEHWAPGTRLLVGTAGVGSMAWGMRKGGLFGTAAFVAGVTLLIRTITNMDFPRLVGLRSRRGNIRFHKTININERIDRVFELWSNPRNFPRFMSHVKEIRVGQDGHTHWVVGGPLSVPMEWDAELTRLEPERTIAWSTLPGSLVAHTGIVHFQENEDGSTRADVQMSYNPPAGAIGHAVAQLFHVDPKVQMDDDLMRMKSFIEAQGDRLEVGV